MAVSNMHRIVIVFALILLPQAAFSGVITSAVNVAASDERVFGSLFYEDDYLIDQSGLVTKYVSGVTDFETYLSSNPIHEGRAQPGLFSLWATNNGVRTATIDFDLGGLKWIDGLVLWNRGGNVKAQIRQFELYAADNSSFVNPVLLGSYDADPNRGTNADTESEVFYFNLVNTSHIRMNILTSNFPTSILSAGEVAFREQLNSVPEPNALLLCGSGLIALVFFTRGWPRTHSGRRSRKRLQVDRSS